MVIQTKYLGEVNITEDQIIAFPFGILGFENNKEFVLLGILENPHFKFLQDIKNPNIAFLLINPWEFFDEYDVEINDENLKKIGINPEDFDKIQLFNIVTLGKTFKESTANLLAPIAINLRERKGKQFIISDSSYTTRHKLFPQGVGE